MMVRNYRFTFNDEDSIDVSGSTITVHNPELIHQLNNVLRLGPESKEEISLINGDGEVYEVEINDKTKTTINFSIIKQSKSKRELSTKVNFFIPVIKQDSYLWMIRKLVELGVQNFIPVFFERSQKQNLDAISSEKQVSRIEKIIQEATEQCEGAVFASITEPIKPLDIEKHIEPGLCIFASERLADEDKLGIDDDIALIKEVDQAKVVNLLVGPEGGLTDNEVSSLKSLGFKPLGLGKRLLKAETATIALFSRLLLD